MTKGEFMENVRNERYAIDLTGDPISATLSLAGMGLGIFLGIKMKDQWTSTGMTVLMAILFALIGGALGNLLGQIGVVQSFLDLLIPGYTPPEV